MAVKVNKEELTDKGKESNPETKFIPAGNQVARFVSYVELGVHKPMFKGVVAKYDSGKNAGREKPAVLHVALQFEFPACEYTGDYPLTISTTRQMENGDFFDAVVVPASLADGTLSRGYALRTKFMKYLTRLQEASGKEYPGLDTFAKEQTPVMVNVTNKEVVAKDGTSKTYANMKPEGIVAPQFQHPITKEIEVVEVPPAKGTYCSVFDWDAPTEEAWTALPPWHKKTIKAALNFDGSPIDLLLKSNPELDKVLEKDEGQDQTTSTPAEPTMSGVDGQPDIQQDMPV